MKVHWFLLILIMIFLISSGCQNNLDQTKEQISKSNKELNNTGIIYATETDPRLKKMVTKLSDFSLDFDGDGSKERIELHTSASKNEDGNMGWDDGQNWLLLIEDGNTYYPLFQQYVQLGSVYFTIWYDDKELPTITAILETGANLSFINYIYDKEKQGYRVEDIYDSGSIYHIFSSIPNY